LIESIKTVLSAAEVFEQEKVEKKKNNYYLRRELRFLDAQLKTEKEDLGNDLFIDFVDSSKSAETNAHNLRKGSGLMLVGLQKVQLTLNLFAICRSAYRFIGSYTETVNHLTKEFVSLHAGRGIIKLVISRQFKLDESIETSHMPKDGKIMVRSVINR
jgi:D-arabinose 1-dehydrogenase-like Zn-dependent alcohol dehydrogenase